MEVNVPLKNPVFKGYGKEVRPVQKQNSPAGETADKTPGSPENIQPETQTISKEEKLSSTSSSKESSNTEGKAGLNMANDPTLAKASAEGAKVRKRNAIISVIFAVIFFAALFWLIKSGQINDTDKIRHMLEKAGPFGPILFILISVFSSYVPIIPMGAMGSIGIALFGTLPAFLYNTCVSYCNCLLAFWLARRFGKRIILWFAAPETVDKYENWLHKWGHYELIFTVFMFMPISPDLVLCMIAGLTGMKFSHFLIIILLSRPFSSWCYSTGMLKLFQWLRHLFHM